MRVRTITTIDEFRQLQAPWDKLLSKSPMNNVYLTWEWLFSWWEIFGDAARKLHIMAIDDDKEELVALAPLLIHEKSLTPFLKTKTLEFLGSGEDEKDEVCSNYLDFIVASGQEAALEIIFQEINKGFKQNLWQIVELKTVPTNSATLIFLDTGSSVIASSEGTKQSKLELRLLRRPTGTPRNDIEIETTEPFPCAVITLPSSWDEYLMSLKRGWRYQIKKGREDLVLQGEIDCRDLTSQADLEPAMKELIDLHQKRWQAQGKPGAFGSPRFQKFHEKVIERFAPNGWVGVRLLKINGRNVAGSYRFLYNQTVYFYQSGYDHTLVSKIGLGVLERSYDIDGAIKSGFRFYDFYKAKAGSYKWHFAKDKREVCDLKIAQKNLAYHLFKGVNLLKGIKRVIVQKITTSA